MSTLTDNDVFLIQQNGETKTVLNKDRSTLDPDNDVFLVQRSGVTHTIKAGDVGGGGNTGSISTPVEVLTPLNGAGMSDTPITPLSSQIVNVGGAGDFTPTTSDITDVQQVGVNEPYASKITIDGTLFAGSSPAFAFDGNPNTSLKVTGDSIKFNCVGIPGFDSSSNLPILVTIDGAFTDGEYWNYRFSYSDGTSYSSTQPTSNPSTEWGTTSKTVTEIEVSIWNGSNISLKSIKLDNVELIGNYQVGSATELTLQDSTNLNLFKQGDTVSGEAGSTQAAAFSTTLYSGDGDGSGTPRNIDTGIDNTAKSLVWIKAREGNLDHALFDTETGVFNMLRSNLGSKILYDINSLQKFNDNGFTTGGSAYTNTTVNYVAWNFRAAPGFLDIVKFKSTTSYDEQIPHSLGSIPGFIILKSTDNDGSWYVYHKDAGWEYNTVNGNWLIGLLSDTVRFDDYRGIDGITKHTDTYFKTRGTTVDNEYIAYVFADTPGKIKCGFYNGNGGTSQIDCGFRPAWVMIRSTDQTTSNWLIYDNKRGDSYPVNLNANRDNAEGSNNWFSFTSTGFQVVNNASDWNEPGYKYVYVAIAEDVTAGEFEPTGELLEDASNATIKLTNTTGTWEAGGPVVKPSIDADLELTFQNPTNLSSMVGPVKMTDENGDIVKAQTDSLSSVNDTTTMFGFYGIRFEPIPFTYELIISGIYHGGNSENFQICDQNGQWLVLTQQDSGGFTRDWSQFALDNNVTHITGVGLRGFSPTTGVGDVPTRTATCTAISIDGLQLLGSNTPIIFTYGRQKDYDSWERFMAGKSSATGDGRSGLEVQTLTFDSNKDIDLLQLNNTITQDDTDSAPLFNIQQYTGTGSSQTITTNIDNTSKSLVWIKGNQTGYDHNFFDTVRGPGWKICTNSEVQDDYKNDGLTSFSNTGYTVKSNSTVNQSGLDLLSFNFRAAPGFMDIIQYTGNAPNTNQVISHGLGETPGMIWIKNISNSGIAWRVWHTYTSWGYLEFKGTPVNSTNIPIFDVTSETFTVGDFNNVNESDCRYIAYVFGNNETRINCGLYSGNNTRREIPCGFKADWVMIKCTNVNEESYVYNSVTGMDEDQENSRIKINSNDGFINNGRIGQSPNGFIINDSGTFCNQIGNTYIYMAISKDATGVPFLPEAFMTSNGDVATNSVQVSNVVGGYNLDKTFSGEETTASATDVMYVDGNKVGLSGVVPTWLTGLYMQGADVSNAAPSPDDVEFTSMNANTTRYSGIDSNLLSRTWTLQYRAVETDAWTTVGVYEDNSVVLNQDGSTPWPDAPTLQPSSYYQVKVKYNASNASPVESVYATFKTAAS